VSKTVTCLGCADDGHVTPSDPIDSGVAGGSARSIADRRSAKRARDKEQRDEAIRRAHPRVGDLVVRVRDVLSEPDRPSSWERGADGEEAVGKVLDGLVPEGFVVLHDRRKPGSKRNIDHVIVGPKGVYVVDAKHYTGLLELRTTGTVFRRGPDRVFVGGRNLDRKVAGLEWQLEWVREAAGDLLTKWGGAICPVLCFVGVEIGLLQQPGFAGAGHVHVTWPRRFVKDIGREGPLGAEQIAAVARQIAQALPPAKG
jgi:hypothetical protein